MHAEWPFLAEGWAPRGLTRSHVESLKLYIISWLVLSPAIKPPKMYIYWNSSEKQQEWPSLVRTFEPFSKYFWGTSFEFWNCSRSSQDNYFMLSLKKPLFSYFVFEPPRRYMLSPFTMEVWCATALGPNSNLYFGSLSLGFVFMTYQPKFKSAMYEIPW